MHLRAKQSISPNNSPNVSQAPGAGKYMIILTGDGKKAWGCRAQPGTLVLPPFWQGHPQAVPSVVLSSNSPNLGSQ